MKLLKKIVAFILREYKISLKNFNDLLTIILFFFLSIFVFIFSIGSDKEILKSIGIGILWSLLLLSSTLSLKRYYQEDFENGTLVIIHMSGLSYELISILNSFMPNSSPFSFCVLNWIRFFALMPSMNLFLYLSEAFFLYKECNFVS